MYRSGTARCATRGRLFEEVGRVSYSCYFDSDTLRRTVHIHTMRFWQSPWCNGTTMSSFINHALLWILLAALTFLIKLYRNILKKSEKSSKHDLHRIPGPISLPFIGTKWIYMFRYKLDKLHEAHEDMKRRYGKIYREVFDGGVCMINVVNRNDIEKILRHPSKYPNRPPSQLIYQYRKEHSDQYLSAGLANENGEVWASLRNKLCQEITSVKTMNNFLPELNVIADDFVQIVKSNKSDKGHIENFEKLASRYGFESCCTLVLGERMTFMDSEISTTAKKLSDAMDQRFQSERDYVYYWGDYTKSSDYVKYLAAENDLYKIVEEYVNKAKKSKEDSHFDGVKCVLMSIVEKDIDEREKKSALIDFAAAGISTLSASLIFLLYLVAKNKDVQRKVYEELEEIAPNSNHITNVDLNQMAYTKACMQEAFRLMPIAYALSRVTDEDVELSGYKIPAGTLISCQTRVACSSEENYTRPKEYLPERWLDDNKETKSAAATVFAPFGSGKRMCPGKRFIEIGLLVTFAKIIREYHIDYEGELDVQFQFILAPKSPVVFKFTERC